MAANWDSAMIEVDSVVWLSRVTWSKPSELKGFPAFDPCPNDKPSPYPLGVPSSD